MLSEQVHRHSCGFVGGNKVNVRPLHGQCAPGLSAKQQLQVLPVACATSSPGSGTELVLAEPSLTRVMFDKVDSKAQKGGQAGGAGGRTTYQALCAADQAWSNLKNMQTGAAAGPAPDFVQAFPRKRIANSSSSGIVNTMRQGTISSSSSSSPCMYDVVVAGGTLGVFVAVALAGQGWRVAVVERGPLAGRKQEWNISRKELQELVQMGLLSPAEAQSVIALEFNPVRVGFHGAADVWTRDVLNLGVRPDKLVSLMRTKLEAAGGKVYENVQLAGVEVCSDGVALALNSQAAAGDGSAGRGTAATPGLPSGPHVQYASTITGRVVLDCMGHASPIVKQLRWGQKPDGVCLVVGGCARGFNPAANTTADIIYTNSNMLKPGTTTASSSSSNSQQLQYFWEAFPAADGFLTPTKQSSSSSSHGWSSDARTTYMFTYMDAQPWRPSLHQLFEDYWRLMPQYQQLDGDVSQLDFVRLLFGMFPTFKDSPLKPGFDRVLQVGDASGIQSPLSFGGFGALTRHLGRLTDALNDALSVEALTQDDLQLVNAYNPGLSSAWMLQRAMTGSRTADGTSAPAELINRMLGANFGAMVDMGDPVLKPFLQDVIQFQPLLRTMAAQMIADPAFVPQLVRHVGPAALADWMIHVGALGAYTALNAAAAPPLAVLARSAALPQQQAYRLRRLLDAWKWGSGADYTL